MPATFPPPSSCFKKTHRREGEGRNQRHLCSWRHVVLAAVESVRPGEALGSASKAKAVTFFFPEARWVLFAGGVAPGQGVGPGSSPDSNCSLRPCAFNSSFLGQPGPGSSFLLPGRPPAWLQSHVRALRNGTSTLT
ncbi:unnamed protein product [Eretmochelys imbricata]